MQQNKINYDNHPYITTCNDVAEIAKPLLKLGISYFNYSRHEINGGRIYMDNTPGITDHYLAKQYYLKGNTENKPTYYKSQIVYWDTLPNQSIVDDTVRSRNIDHGIFLIEPGEDCCEFFSFATKKGNSGIINTYLTQMDYLKKFTADFKEQAASLIKLVDAKKMILPFNNDPIDLSNCNNLDTITIRVNQTLQKYKFSARQLDVAYEILQAKKIKSIAAKLKLSPRTIESYVNNLKIKLSCPNKTALIIKLAEIFNA